jgi:hypothetical protein
MIPLCDKTCSPRPSAVVAMEPAFSPKDHNNCKHMALGNVYLESLLAPRVETHNSYKVNAIINCVEVVFWGAVVFLVLQRTWLLPQLGNSQAGYCLK